MVDYDSYFQYGPADGRNGALEPGNIGAGCSCSDCQNNDGLVKRYRTWIDEPKHSQAREWEPEQYLLCPPRVLGYILQDKRWAQLQVTCLERIPPLTQQDEVELFKQLQLADDPDLERIRRLQQRTQTKPQAKRGKSLQNAFPLSFHFPNFVILIRMLPY